MYHVELQRMSSTVFCMSNVDNRTLHYIDHGIQVLIVLCAHRKHITLFVTFRSIISLLLSAEECQSLKTYR